MINVANLKPAVIGAGEIATNSSVDQKVLSVSDTANLALSTATTASSSSLNALTVAQAAQLLASQDPAERINTGTTTIDGGKITTGSITSAKILAGAIGTSQLSVGLEIVNGSVKSSDFTTIGGAGFRLKSNAAGTSADPTIYGAYIRGGTIEGTNISGGTITGATLVGQVLNISNLYVANSSYPSNTTDFAIVKTALAEVGYSGSAESSVITFYSASYASGYRNDRIINSSKSRIVRMYGSDIGNHIVYRSIDGGAWNVVLSNTAGGSLNNNVFVDTTAFVSSVRYKSYTDVPAADNSSMCMVEVCVYNIG